MKIALVHEYLTQLGGGEKVLQAFCEMFPEAPIYTLIYDDKATRGVFKDKKIHTSFLQKIPGSKRFFRSLIPLMPLAVEQFNLSGFDLVISVSHSYGKGIITRPGTKHICYCLTPTRYLWFTPTLMHELWGHSAAITLLKPFLYPLLTYLRTWDYQAAQRPDCFIADSETVRQRIKKYYNRDSEVVYPPVDIGRFHISDRPKNYFLMTSRMVPYKRFDVAIEAFSKLPEEKLLVIGDWPVYSRLKTRNRYKTGNIEFLGRVSDDELPRYYAECKAIIFPQEEDFGIVPVEAMAAGRPVIAFRAGGVLETVIEGETGLFFEEQTPESLAEAVKSFDETKFDPEKIRRHAEKFDKSVFKDQISRLIKN